MTKDGVVRSIERAAEAIGHPLLNAWGRRRFGGHSLRVSGARWLAGIGLEASKIQSLARWSSDIVLPYVADAHIAAIAADCKIARAQAVAVGRAGKRRERDSSASPPARRSGLGAQ